MEEPEIWTVKKIEGKTLVGIITNKSNWFIAEELLPKHAKLICDLFNKQPVKKY